VPEQPQAWHKYIEFSNRMLTFVLVALALAALWAGIKHRKVLVQADLPARPQLLALSTVPFIGTVAQAVLGGITVRTHLNPAAVAAHLLLSVVVVGGTLVLLARAAEDGDNPVTYSVGVGIRRLGQVLVVVVAAVITVGTVVTGSGPHAGDASAPRFRLNPSTLSWIHADLVMVLCVLAVALTVLLVLSKAPRRCLRVSLELIFMIVLQAVIGFTQYFTGLPEALVAIHVLGASVLWVAVIRIPLSLRTRGALTPTS